MAKEQASFNFMTAVTICNDFEAQGNKVCHYFHCFPIYLPWSNGARCHDLSFLNVEFYFANKGLSSQSYGFSSSHVWMWELDHREGWAPKDWCFWTVVLEKTLKSPLDGKEIKLVHHKGNQSWIFIGRTDDEVETPIFWLTQMQRTNSLEMTLMLGKIDSRKRRE